MLLSPKSLQSTLDIMMLLPRAGKGVSLITMCRSQEECMLISNVCLCRVIRKGRGDLWGMTAPTQTCQVPQHSPWTYLVPETHPTGDVTHQAPTQCKKGMHTQDGLPSQSLYPLSYNVRAHLQSALHIVCNLLLQLLQSHQSPLSHRNFAPSLI